MKNPCPMDLHLHLPGLGHLGKLPPLEPATACAGTDGPGHLGTSEELATRWRKRGEFGEKVMIIPCN